MPKKKKKNFIKGQSDYILWVVTLLLLALGLIMVLSASTPASLTETKGKSSYEYLQTQAVAAILGLAGMYLLSRININVYKKISPIIYIGATILMFYTGFYGSEKYGARRWLYIKPFPSFQPSEIAKYCYIIFFAHYLSWAKKTNKIKKITWGVIIPVALLAVPVFALYKLQNHLSATLLISATVVVQMFVGGCSLVHMAAVFGIAISGIFGYLTLTGKAGTGFRDDRIDAWKNPEKYATGKGFQILQSMYAIASGGIFGLGIGNSKQKYILPEPQNDFIFAILAEELGFIGCMVVVMLFIILIWRGIVIARKVKDTYAKLIAIGVTVIIGLQVILNIAVVTNTIPVTGIPLPFFSYGGTALVINLCAIGLLQNVSRLAENEIE